MKRLLPFILLLLLSLAGKAQLIIDSVAGMTPEQLVKTYLLGEGVQVRNVTYNGSSAPFDSKGQVAIFRTGKDSTGLGFETGIILSTGKASNVLGPNNKRDAGTKWNTPGDSLLSAVLKNMGASVTSTFDAAVLEFDFKTISDQIAFDYIFGSEEYPEYVDASVNDIFGFFVTGRNEIGMDITNKNIALIPGTDIAISINTVNYGFNNWDYIPGKGANPKYYRSNKMWTSSGETPLNKYIQADGLTVPLVAQTGVLPCAWTHIKIAIADVSDSIYDSWVWLKANSFKADKPVIRLDSTSVNDTVLLEGCSSTKIRLDWSGGISTSFGVTYKGTATKGVDYTVVMKDSNGQIIKDDGFTVSGNSFATLEITALLDTLTEGDETIMLLVRTSICPEDTNKVDTITLTIRDYIAPKVQMLGDTSICSYDVPTTLPFSVKILNRDPQDFKYTWSTGDSTASIQVYFTDTISKTYYVTIQDTCQTFMDSVKVKVIPFGGVQAKASTYVVCPKDKVILTATGTDKYRWSSELSDPSLMGQNTQAVVTIYPAQTNVYTVLGTSMEGCESTQTVAITVKPRPEARFNATPNPVLQLDPSVRFKDVSMGVVARIWDLGDGHTSYSPEFIHKYSSFDTASYLVTLVVTGDGGCKDSTQQIIRVKPDVTIYIPNAFIPDLADLNVNTFKVYGINLQDFELFIFDRWGKQIFHTKDPLKGWNGTFQGQTLPEGVYMYYVKYRDAYGHPQDKKGSITLIR